MVLPKERREWRGGSRYTEALVKVIIEGHEWRVEEGF
jgi:hypothetical protein